jgi:hypothetical protein
MMRLFPLILVAAAIAFAGCDKMTPAPEVEITDVEPLTGVVGPDGGGGYLEIAKITFAVNNYVDAIVTSVQIAFFDSKGESAIAPTLPPIGMHFNLPGTYGLTADLTGMAVPVSDEVVNYIYTTNDYVIARLYFYGEDAYGYDMDFLVKMDWGIWKLQ